MPNYLEPRDASTYRGARRNSAREKIIPFVPLNGCTLREILPSEFHYARSLAPTSKYAPHQNTREKARRVRQMAASA